MKHKNIHSTFLALLCGGLSGLYAQQSVNAAGGNATGNGGSASYSIGQVAYLASTGSSGSSNAGVQQPYEFFTTGIDELKAASLSMTTYPNPAQATVNLRIDGPVATTLNYRLYDVSGQLVTSGRITGSLTTLPLQTLAAGTYLLKVSDTQQALKSFTIIKNN